MFIFIVCNQKVRYLQILPVATLKICYIALKMLKVQIISVFHAEELQARSVIKHEEAAGVVFLLSGGVTVFHCVDDPVSTPGSQLLVSIRNESQSSMEQLMLKHLLFRHEVSKSC